MKERAHDSEEGRFLDVTSWSRRNQFEYFRSFENPYFNVCSNVDVTQLLRVCRSNPDLSFSVSYLFLSLLAANRVEPFRYRIRDGRVFVYSRVNGGVTVLLDDQSFAFCYFDFDESFQRFHDRLRIAIEQVRSAPPAFDPRLEKDDLVHHTVLPWTSFTSVSHPRMWSRPDSIPKIAFGKYFEERGSVRMPVSVEVHHALMDGLHVGRYLQLLEGALADPEEALSLEKADRVIRY